MHVTDISNAARTNWMDISSGRWHPETMALFGATNAMLPEIRSNAEVYGYARHAAICTVSSHEMSKVSHSRHTYSALCSTGASSFPATVLRLTLCFSVW